MIKDQINQFKELSRQANKNLESNLTESRKLISKLEDPKQKVYMTNLLNQAVAGNLKVEDLNIEKILKECPST